MGRFFTSDWHLNETRITPERNLFFRPFKSIEEQNRVIIDNCNNIIGEDDELIHLGDVSYDVEGINLLDQIKCKNRTLIIGNYDENTEGKLDELRKYFNVVEYNLTMEINGQKYVLNHYPAKYTDGVMNIVGHIHGLWKVQPQMINVGVDAWNYEPIDEAKISFLTTAIGKFYDQSVFPMIPSLKTIQAGMTTQLFKTGKE